MAEVACTGEGPFPSVPRAADGCVAGAWQKHMAVRGTLKLLLIAATNFSDFSEKPHNH